MLCNAKHSNANYSSLEYVFIGGTCETQVKNEISLSKSIGIIVLAKHTFVVETETNFNLSFCVFYLLAKLKIINFNSNNTIQITQNG